MDFARPLGVVTPTLDGDVLVALARSRGSFTGREVHRLVGHSSEQGVRNALGRLVGQGIVVAEPAGQATLYTLNRDHLAAPPVEALTHLRQSLIERMAEVVGEWDPAAAAVAIFGSVATGTAGPASDVDLLVVRPKGVEADDMAWRLQVDNLCGRVTRWTGNDTRLLEYGIEELAPAQGDTDAVLREAAEVGLMVAGDLPALLRRRRR